MCVLAPICVCAHARSVTISCLPHTRATRLNRALPGVEAPISTQQGATTRGPSLLLIRAQFPPLGVCFIPIWDIPFRPDKAHCCHWSPYSHTVPAKLVPICPRCVCSHRLSQLVIISTRESLRLNGAFPGPEASIFIQARIHDSWTKPSPYMCSVSPPSPK